jgi:hypothetical protein
MWKVLVTTLIWMLGSAQVMQAAAKQHVIFLGKPILVKLFLGPDDNRSVSIKARPLYVDGRLREFTAGEAHDITDRQFAVQRVYRVNDSLPGDERKIPQWRWQRGGWLLVDRSTGRVSPIRLPAFDAFYSEVVWYREYAAYCGISDTGDKLYAVVAQIGIRKPILLNPLQTVDGTEPESPCERPAWQRAPAKVTFSLRDGRKQAFEVHGRAVDLAPPEEEAN